MRRTLSAALLGGFVAGTIDIGSAALINRASPVVICRAIAAGVLGTASFHEGARAAVLGLLLQWGMAMIIALLYVAGTALIPPLRARWGLGGFLAGVATFVVMNYVVLPLSAVGHAPHFTLQKGLENFAALVFFAEIIAAFVYCGSHLRARNS